MNASQDIPAAASPASATSPAFAPVLGLLALATSLVAVALTLADDLGAGATTALIAADVVLIAAMGALLAAQRPQSTPGVPLNGLGAQDARENAARRRRDDELLDALEPLDPAGRARDDQR
ncbi:hypothetical protein ACIQ9P_32055 [Kitasatospora sp. NPDC094019]|uniref:hypothetical protein n=1 Tax=Kitasatospora sp. NPDC094019 TaxID=3364091 RepID=UPI0038197E86